MGRPRKPPSYRVADDGCWVWQGGFLGTGYGWYSWEKRAAHRWAYEQAYGPIPTGKHIDHICRNRACVNPEHLRLATPSQNAQNRAATNRNGSSRFRGVWWNRQHKKWWAGVSVNGHHHYLGMFRDEEAAGRAAADARARLMPSSPEAHDNRHPRRDGRSWTDPRTTSGGVTATVERVANLEDVAGLD